MDRAKLVVAVCAACTLSCGPKDGSGEDDAAAGVADSGAGTDAPFEGCAEDIYDGEQAPAAMLVLLDRSQSMGENNKWSFAAQAIALALDQDVFDGTYLGLYTAPSGVISGPSCIFGLPVPCLAPPFPQIDLANAGTDKSTDATGVRKAIRAWLTSNGPAVDMFGADATPLYDAIQNSIAALQAWPETGHRILFIVSDGTISCTQFSGRTGFEDCNGCDHDWEHPQNIIDLLSSANSAYGIESFVVGVPGADTNPTVGGCDCPAGGPGCNIPPYSMRLALSAMANAGSPAFAPAGCDGTVFTPAGADPTLSCHFDMTQGFTAQEMADTISQVRGDVLGCVFELPTPPEGQTIDVDRVNVEYTHDGTTVSPLPRRSDPSDPCDTNECWDYNADDDIEILGAACANIQGASSVQVKIITGCQTIVL